MLKGCGTNNLDVPAAKWLQENLGGICKNARRTARSHNKMEFVNKQDNLRTWWWILSELYGALESPLELSTIHAIS